METTIRLLFFIQKTGYDGSGVTAFVIAHEFTHSMQDNSPELFHKLGEIIISEAQKMGIDTSELMDHARQKVKSAAEYRGKSTEELNDIDYDEFIAEAMETIFTDTDALSRISDRIRNEDKTLWGKIVDFLKGIVERLRTAYKNADPDSAIAKQLRPVVQQSEKILDAFVNAAVDSIDNAYTLSPDNEGTVFNAAGEEVAMSDGKVQQAETDVEALDQGEVRNSIREIVGDSGTNYGVGVYLDSTLLDGLSDTERKEMVKLYIKETGGSVFTAFDKNGNKVDIKIADSTKFKAESGRRVPANRDLLYYSGNPVKQEAVALIDELVMASDYSGTDPATHKHDWLDNNGANPWDIWTVHIQEKNNAVWEASLRIANTTNGEKVLYDIYPINMVEGPRTVGTTSTASIVSQPAAGINTQTQNNSNSRSSTRTSPETMEAVRNAIADYRAQQDALNKAAKALYEQERKQIVAEYKKQQKELERSYSAEVEEIQQDFFSLARNYEEKTMEAAAKGPPAFCSHLHLFI